MASNIEMDLASFLESRRARCTGKIVEWYDSHLKLFLQWLAERNIFDIHHVTLVDLEAYITSLKERERFNRQGKLSPVTIQKRITAIKTFFLWAVKTKRIDESPAVDLPRPSSERGRRLPKALTPPQVRKLWSVSMNIREKAIVSLMLDSGLRESEVIGLEFNDIDFELGELHVRHGKGDKERYALFGKEVGQLLQEWIAIRKKQCWTGEAIFTGQQGPLKRIGIYKLVKAVLKRAGIEAHPHCLRHTFATEYLEAGGQPSDLQILMGHGDIQTTMIYIAVTRSRLRVKHRELSLINRLNQGKYDTE